MPGPIPPRPLALTADDGLLDDLVRLAAVTGSTLDVAADLTLARRSWSHAPVVLVGGDRADAVVRATPPRRRDVYLVRREGDGSAAWQAAVRLGAEDVLTLPDQEEQLVARLADAAEGVNRDATVVGVVGGRGGAGASTLAVALAVTAVRAGLATLLVDADPLGGGIDLVLGNEGLPGMRWPDLLSTRGRVSPTALREALPRPDALGVLSWDRGEALEIPPEAMRAVLGSARRGNDAVVVDLPRYLDAATEEALGRCTTVLIVVPAEVRAVAAAGRATTALAPLAHDLRVVVRLLEPARLDADLVATTLRLPLAGELRPEPGIDQLLNEGGTPGRRGRGPLAEFSRGFVQALTERAAA